MFFSFHFCVPVHVSQLVSTSHMALSPHPLPLNEAHMYQTWTKVIKSSLLISTKNITLLFLSTLTQNKALLVSSGHLQVLPCTFGTNKKSTCIYICEHDLLSCRAYQTSVCSIILLKNLGPWRSWFTHGILFKLEFSFLYTENKNIACTWVL